MKKRPLSSLVAIYNRENGPNLDDDLQFYRNLASIDDAIRFACHGRNGKIHKHQRRVGRATLEHARKVLHRHTDKITACKSFDDLLTLVENRTSSIDRFGVLAAYDTSLRLGAYLGLSPQLVYTHAGTKKGCKALNVPTKGGKVEMVDLPSPINDMEPYHAENFLCIFKDRFSGVDEAGKEPDPRKTRSC